MNPVSLALVGMLTPMATGCVTLSELTVAPFPCSPQLFPVPMADMNPRQPRPGEDRGVCVRAKIQENAR